MEKKLIKQAREREKWENMHLIEQCFEDGLEDEEIAQTVNIHPWIVKRLRDKFRGDG